MFDMVEVRNRHVFEGCYVETLYVRGEDPDPDQQRQRVLDAWKGKNPSRTILTQVELSVGSFNTEGYPWALLFVAFTR